MTDETRKARKARKRAEAEARQAEYAALTLEQKLDRALTRGHADTYEYRELLKQAEAQR